MVCSFRPVASASQASLGMDHLWSDRHLCRAPIASVENRGIVSNAPHQVSTFAAEDFFSFLSVAGVILLVT